MITYINVYCQHPGMQMLDAGRPPDTYRYRASSVQHLNSVFELFDQISLNSSQTLCSAVQMCTFSC
jgi:hypothetical protein